MLYSSQENCTRRLSWKAIELRKVEGEEMLCPSHCPPDTVLCHLQSSTYFNLPSTHWDRYCFSFIKWKYKHRYVCYITCPPPSHSQSWCGVDSLSFIFSPPYFALPQGLWIHKRQDSFTMEVHKEEWKDWLCCRGSRLVWAWYSWKFSRLRIKRSAIEICICFQLIL